jgi:hypothetical protein
LNDESLKIIAKNFPKLFCLDISHNRLESLPSAVITLHGLTDLKMLYLIGNPLMLCPGYRNVLKTKLKALKVLDGTPTLNEQESTKKKKKVTGSALGNYSQPVAIDYQAMVADINDNFSLDLHLRVLHNIDGVYLTEETCKPEILETL